MLRDGQRLVGFAFLTRDIQIVSLHIFGRRAVYRVDSVVRQKTLLQLKQVHALEIIVGHQALYLLEVLKLALFADQIGRLRQKNVLYSRELIFENIAANFVFIVVLCLVLSEELAQDSLRAKAQTARLEALLKDNLDELLRHRLPSLLGHTRLIQLTLVLSLYDLMLVRQNH